MRISELYGPVSQGEGFLLGECMPFIRVAACNLSCSWCDSKYTWEKGYQYTEMTPEQVAEQAIALAQGCSWVSLTGGEPTVQARECGRLVHLLLDAGLRVIVETNGLAAPDWFHLRQVFVSCSPKLPNSGQDTPARRRRVAELVRQRKGHVSETQWKFVIAGQADLDALEPYCASVGICPEHGIPIYLQPDGYIQPIDKYLEALSWLQREAPVWARVTPQVHRLIHGPDAKGV